MEGRSIRQQGNDFPITHKADAWLLRKKQRRQRGLGGINKNLPHEQMGSRFL
jgi:hypothetical protein